MFKRRLKKLHQQRRKFFSFKKRSETSSSDEYDDNGEDDLDDDVNTQCNVRSTSSPQKRLDELIAPVSSKYQLERDLGRLGYICAFFCSGSPRLNRLYRLFSGLIWVFSIFLHFGFDVNEAFQLYGYTFLTAQGVWLLNFIVITCATSFRLLPWLNDGLRQLRRDECYEKTITKVLQTIGKVPYIIITFGLLASGCQHIFLYIDNAFHLDYAFPVTKVGEKVLHIIRFLAGVHVYAGYVIFWLIPSTVMLMTGYSMAEFLGQFDAKIRDKERGMTFKEAIASYSARAKFVKNSSSKCGIVLSFQLLSVVVCFGLNTYMFFFSATRRYLHVFHSIVPLIVMMYPLCCAAWVTKQYTWFIIVVVKAWVHRDDLDSDSSDTDSGIDELSTSQGRFSKLLHVPLFKKKVNNSPSTLEATTNSTLSRSLSTEILSKPSNIIRRQSTGNLKSQSKSVVELLPWQKDVSSKLSDKEDEKPEIKKEKRFFETVTTARAVSKFKTAARRPRFNFEKFLSYLESMRSVVGFSIAGVMITWDKVSTTLFLLFSIIAVFMQESIFGSKKSTLE